MENSAQNKIFKSLRVVAIIMPLIFWPTAFALAEDNGPLPEGDKLCQASTVICEQSCDMAKLTRAQHIECGVKCQEIGDKCTDSAARQGKIQRDLNAKGNATILEVNPAPATKKRKKLINKQ